MLEPLPDLEKLEQRRSWTFDFMGASRWFFSMSGCILAIGALAIGAKGLNFGIDFESGTRIEAQLVKPTDEGKVRQVMASQGLAPTRRERFEVSM